MQHPTERTAHTIAFTIPVVEHWLDSSYELRYSHFNQCSTTGVTKTVRHMVKDHSDSEKERENPLQHHGLLFLVGSKGSFTCSSAQT